MPSPVAVSDWSVGRDALRALSTKLLIRTGAPAVNAGLVSSHLVEADSMGVRSHGIMRLPQYVDAIRHGEIDPVARPFIAERRPGRLEADCGGGFGQVAGMDMAEAVARRTRELGIAIATGRRLGHTGRLGAYSERLARDGLIAIAVSSGPMSGHLVAPFGGREGRLPPNPIAVAWPVAGDDIVSADFSTSMVPEGVVRSLRNRGLRAPEGALHDATGRQTTDPAALYQDPPGAIRPLGGPVGYRGTALALMVEVLATLLPGDAVDDVDRRGSNLSIIGIEPSDGFGDLAAGLGHHIRSATPIDPSSPVLMPGDRERAAARSEAGVAVDEPTWKWLTAAAQEAGLDMPVSSKS